MKTITAFILILAVAVCSSCSFSANRAIAGSGISPDTLDRILVNQVGYSPSSAKIALLRVKTVSFDIVDANSGKVVFTGIPGPFKYWELSGDSVCTADFSKVTAPGKYQLCLNDKSVCSYVFEIGQNVYADIAKASLKAFYLNRSGIEITKEFGGKWERTAGNHETVVLVHTCAASADRHEG